MIRLAWIHGGIDSEVVAVILRMRHNVVKKINILLDQLVSCVSLFYQNTISIQPPNHSYSKIVLLS